MAGDANPLEEAATKRLAAARIWKNLWELDFKECYFLASPHRQRQISSMTQPALQRLLDAPDLYTDIAFLIIQDFVTEIVNTFLPEAQPWAERNAGQELDSSTWAQIENRVRADDQKIFEAIKASNFYAEIPKSFYPDLGIGTAGLMIQKPDPAGSIVCSAIPLREMEINLGPYGMVDDRFVVRHTRNCYVRELLGDDIWNGDKIPADLKKDCDDKPQDRTILAWGYWRQWDKKGDEHWQHVVMVRNKLVHDAELKGEGSCPLVICRFNPSADWPWGLGPLLQGLPSYRQADELERMRLEAASRGINPPITYPYDSFANVEQGLEDGVAYPVRPGEQEAIKNIYEQPKGETATYSYEEKIKTLRKLAFVDYPEQTGDTPPTLGQWIDEMARAQRRIGTPGMSFWAEGPAQFFLRFKFLLEASGVIKPVQVNGRAVSLRARNPAQAAAEQQEVAMAFRSMQMLAPMFPEEWKMYVDGRQTIGQFLKKMRVTLVKLRDDKQVQAAVDQISKLAGARHVGEVPPNAGTPGPAAIGP